MVNIDFIFSAREVTTSEIIFYVVIASFAGLILIGIAARKTHKKGISKNSLTVLDYIKI